MAAPKEIVDLVERFESETYLKSTKKVFSEIQARQIAQLPIRTIDFSDPVDKTRHNQVVSWLIRCLSNKAA